MNEDQPIGTGIRRGAPDDLTALNDLYNHYVRETHVTFDITPIGLEHRREWFRRFRESGPHQLFVATDATGLLGAAWSGEFRAKEAYASSAETTIYLAPGAVGRGLGSRLYATLLDALASTELHRAYAGIAIPNPASIRLHEKLGFRAVGSFDSVGRKFGSWWSVRWFELRLDELRRAGRNG